MESSIPSDQVIHGNAVCNADIHGDLGSVLREFKTEICNVDDLIIHPAHLVADHETKRINLEWDLIWRGRVARLLQHGNCESLLMEFVDYGTRRLVLTPGDGVLRPEGRLVKVLVLRRSGESSEMNVFDTGSVRRPKNGPHIVYGPYIVNQHPDRVLRQLFELVRVGPLDFIPTQFAHRRGKKEIREGSGHHGGRGALVQHSSVSS